MSVARPVTTRPLYSDLYTTTWQPAAAFIANDSFTHNDLHQYLSIAVCGLCAGLLMYLSSQMNTFHLPSMYVSLMSQSHRHLSRPTFAHIELDCVVG